MVDGDAGVGHRLVRERVDLGRAAQVDDGAHAAFLDQVHDVVGRGVGERVAAEDAVAAGHAVAASGARPRSRKFTRPEMSERGASAIVRRLFVGREVASRP